MGYQISENIPSLKGKMKSKGSFKILNINIYGEDAERTDTADNL